MSKILSPRLAGLVAVAAVTGALVGGCERRQPTVTDTLPSTTTPMPSTTTPMPMPPASPASR